MRLASDLDVPGKRVLVRCDLNVPLEDGAAITDDGRIRASVPLLRDLLDRGAKVVVTAHLGRPKGAPDPAYSLAPVGAAARGAARRPGADGRGRRRASRPQEAVARASSPTASCCSRTSASRPRETSKDDAERGAFADQLAAFADLYVDDAFGAVHRKHASVYDVAQRLPHAAGPLVAAEVEVLQRLTEDPARPVRRRARRLQGQRQAQGHRGAAAQGRHAARRRRHVLHLPRRAGPRRRLEPARGRPARRLPRLPRDRQGRAAGRRRRRRPLRRRRRRTTSSPADAIPSDRMGLDIGPQSVEVFADALAGAAHGVLERPDGRVRDGAVRRGHPRRRRGGRRRSAADALTVVGGGDSAAAVRALGIDEDRFTHISTGGGASLEYLEGKALPGLTVLED